MHPHPSRAQPTRSAYFFFPLPACINAACAAASLAIGTRNGEQLT